MSDYKLRYKSMQINYKAYCLYLFVVLISVAFFNPFGVISNTRLPIHIFEIAVVVSMVYAIFLEQPRLKWNHTYCFFVFFCVSTIISLFMADMYHGQPIMMSFFSTFPILGGFLLFPILLKFNIPSNKIIKTIKILLIISAIVYGCNMLLPVRIFKWGRFDVDSGRGITRAWIPFLELHVLSLFYHIGKYIEKKNQGNCVKWIIFAFSMILLSLTRQYILGVTILGGWFMLKKLSVSHKIVFIALFSIALYGAQQTSFVKDMTELTSKQVGSREDAEDNVRMQALLFFIEASQTNELTEIFGNGVLSTNSDWGEELQNSMTSYGYAVEDIGWCGIYFFFGWFGLLSLLLFFICTVLKKKKPSDQYLTYWMIFVTFSSVLSGLIIYSHQILSISTVLYLIYKQPSESE